ncbi:Nn.00g045600.m01.CDS01 [Neocucurbitaria sp. VM-36]
MSRFHPKLVLAALAATASAQLTTSFWMLEENLGTDKIGYYGSVVDANNTHTTLALSYDNGTDTSALGFGGSSFTMTVGPTLWEAADNIGSRTTESNNANVYRLRCDQPNPSETTANVTCTASYGSEIASLFRCNTQSRPSSTGYYTQTHTYSGRATYSAGVETITRSFIYGPDTRIKPDWCTDELKFPEGGYVSSFPVERKNFATYQVVITAGEEKLDATQGASATFSSATPTGSQASTGPSGSVAGPQETGAAAPLARVGPVMVSLGAAAACFVL